MRYDRIADLKKEKKIIETKYLMGEIDRETAEHQLEAIITELYELGGLGAIM